MTPVVCRLVRPFLEWPPLESVCFCRLKRFCFFISGLQNIHVDIDIQNICGLEADIKIRDTYHIAQLHMPPTYICSIISAEIRFYFNPFPFFSSFEAGIANAISSFKTPSTSQSPH